MFELRILDKLIINPHHNNFPISGQQHTSKSNTYSDHLLKINLNPVDQIIYYKYEDLATTVYCVDNG